MTLKVLSELLTQYGHAERDGDTLRVAGDRQTDVFANIGDDILNITKIKQLELLHDVLVVTTCREEIYALAYEDVRALHFGAPEGNKTGY